MANITRTEQTKGKESQKFRQPYGYSGRAQRAAKILGIDLNQIRSITELKRVVKKAWSEQAFAYHPDQSEMPDVDALHDAQLSKDLLNYLTSLATMPSAILLHLLIEHDMIISSDALASGTDHSLQDVDAGYGWQVETRWN